MDNLNSLAAGTDWESKTLEEIVKTAPAGPIFNNAAQIWNHTFYFESLLPPADIAKSRGRDDLTVESMAASSEAFSAPKGGTPLSDAIARKWSDVDDLKKEFKDVALKTFGS